jgi:hypothetical protein
MLLGGLVFWVPNILIHWLRAYRFSNFDVIGLTVLLPATTYLFFQMVWWPARNRHDRLSSALFVVLGIWISGPSMLTLSLSVCDRLSRLDAWHFFTIGTLLFPLFTILMSTYDGSVFAVLLTTLALLIFANARLRSSAH